MPRRQGDVRRSSAALFGGVLVILIGTLWCLRGDTASAAVDQTARLPAGSEDSRAPHVRAPLAVREVLPGVAAGARKRTVAARRVSIAGRIRDERGVALSGLALALQSVPRSAGHRAATGVDADGRFVFEGGVAPGRYELGLSTPGHVLLRPLSVVAEAEPLELDVVVATRSSIAGVVVDETGSPVAGVRFRVLVHESTAATATSAPSTASGAFTIYGPPDLHGSVGVQCVDPGPCEPPSSALRARWGERRVRVTMRRATGLEIRVVERQSRRPVERFGVICRPVGSWRVRDWKLRLRGRHPRGVLRIAGVRAGKTVLRVVPEDSALEVGEQIEIDTSRQNRIQVELDRMLAVGVRVRDAAGRPVAKAEVELVRAGSEPFDAASQIADPRRGGMSVAYGDVRPHRLCSRSQTAGDGTATVHAPEGVSGMALRVRPPTGGAVVRSDLSFRRTGSTIEVVVGSTGGLRGVVVLHGWRPDQVDLLLRRSERPTTSHTVRIAKEGAFASDGLAPGDWDVSLRVRGDEPVALRPALARVRIEAGVTLERRLDVERFRPATIRGRVDLDSRPAANLRAYLERVGSAPQARVAQLALDEEAGFGPVRLAPGEYRMHVLAMVGARELDIPGRETFRLGPGTDMQRLFSIRRRTARVRLLSRAGKPLVRTRVRVLAPGGGTVTTDAQGWLSLDPAPAVVTVQLVDRPGCFAGPIELPADPADPVDARVHQVAPRRQSR